MFGLSMLAVGAAFLSAPNVVITNVAACARPAAGSADAWRPLAYETQDGISGTMLYAPGCLKPRTRFELPLGVKGKYRIFLGLFASRDYVSYAPYKVLVRLSHDPAPVEIDAQALSSDAGWWQQPTEVEWKTAELCGGDSLVVENLRNCRIGLCWVRLEPVEKLDDFSHPVHEMIATDDAYAYAEDFDELAAPLMRFANSPVRKVMFCVGNGAWSFAAPSALAQSSAYREGDAYDTSYARDCAFTYAKLQKEHPHLVDDLADFAHKIGLQFHVSFRTGCVIDFVRFGDAHNAAEPGVAARGICRPENYCRLWDGTPVARFSYANDAVQDFFQKFYAEQLTEKVDGINLIWIRALPAMLFEQAFREKFKAAYGEELAKPDDPRIVALRCEIMTDYHRRVRQLAGKKFVSIFVPATVERCRELGLDIGRLAREGLVDEFYVGDCMQVPNHSESFSLIQCDGFRKALAGTKAKFRTFLWNGSLPNYRASLAGGADGIVYWDGGVKAWRNWEWMRRLTDDDGVAAEAWSKTNPTSGRVHPLKTLQGFDAKDFPWHVPY